MGNGLDTIGKPEMESDVSCINFDLNWRCIACVSGRRGTRRSSETRSCQRKTFTCDYEAYTRSPKVPTQTTSSSQDTTTYQFNAILCDENTFGPYIPSQYKALNRRLSPVPIYKVLQIVNGQKLECVQANSKVCTVDEMHPWLSLPLSALPSCSLGSHVLTPTASSFAFNNRQQAEEVCDGAMTSHMEWEEVELEDEMGKIGNNEVME
ncbi:uncharacterized protein LOC142491972 [Ascaphus truei]|uniref:uncharacterized protein LOC142491972 n=1 Tax=Ascaphus truei TaxID=8439 RepID=UPI003F5A8C02